MIQQRPILTSSL